MNQVTHPLSSADISISSPEINKFSYIKKYRYRLPFNAKFVILLTFLEFWNIFLINMVITFMISAKMATSGLLKIIVFWNKCYDVIITAHDVTNKVFSRNSNYTVDVVMQPKFGNSSISVREVIITSIL